MGKNTRTRAQLEKKREGKRSDKKLFFCTLYVKFPFLHIKLPSFTDESPVLFSATGFTMRRNGLACCMVKQSVVLLTPLAKPVLLFHSLLIFHCLCVLGDASVRSWCVFCDFFCV